MNPLNIGLVLALVALYPCVIHGRLGQDYSNGILFEAPADVPRINSDKKISFKEFHNKLEPFFRIMSDHIPISKLKDPDEFKKYLEQEHLFDEPEDVLYDSRTVVNVVYNLLESAASCIPFGSAAMWILHFVGIKDSILNLFGGEEKTPEDLEREALLENADMITTAMRAYIAPLFNAAVERTVPKAVEERISNEKRYWNHRMKRLAKKAREMERTKPKNYYNYNIHNY